MYFIVIQFYIANLLIVIIMASQLFGKDANRINALILSSNSNLYRKLICDCIKVIQVLGNKRVYSEILIL